MTDFAEPNAGDDLSVPPPWFQGNRPTLRMFHQSDDLRRKGDRRRNSMGAHRLASMLETGQTRPAVRLHMERHMWFRWSRVFLWFFLTLAITVLVINWREMTGFLATMKNIGPGHTAEEQTIGLLALGLVFISIVAMLRIAVEIVRAERGGHRPHDRDRHQDHRHFEHDHRHRPDPRRRYRGHGREWDSWEDY